MNHHDVMMERAFLGSVLTGEGGNDHLLATLRAGDFTDGACRRVFAEMNAARLRGTRLDVRMVASFAREADAASEDFVSSLVQAVATPLNGGEYARRLSELGGLRDLARLNGAAIAAEAESLELAVGEMRQRLAAVETGRSRHRIAGGEDLVAEFRGDLESDEVEGIATGIETLDVAIGGLAPSALYIVAARPSVGKSALMSNIAEHQALRCGGRVALFSLEMPKKRVTRRLVASLTGIPATKLKDRNLTDREWERAYAAMSKIAASPLLVDDRPGVTVSAIHATAKTEHIRSPLALVVVDYLQLVQGSRSRKGENREQEVAEVARGLKLLAMDLGVPVVAGAQLNREVERRGDKRPILADLRESGEIEQSADVVMMLHREWMTDRHARPDDAEVLVRKNRDGEVGELRLRFDGSVCRFEDASR